MTELMSGVRSIFNANHWKWTPVMKVNLGQFDGKGKYPKSKEKKTWECWSRTMSAEKHINMIVRETHVADEYKTSASLHG